MFLNDDCLLEETREYSSNNCSTPVKLILSKPVKIKPNKRCETLLKKQTRSIVFISLLCCNRDLTCRYDITTELTGGPTLYGRNAQKVETNQWFCSVLTDLKMVNFDFLWLWCLSRKVVSSTGASGSTFDVTFFTSPLGGKPDLFSLLSTTFWWHKKESDPSWFVQLRSKWGRNWDGAASCTLLQVFVSNFYTYME